MASSRNQKRTTKLRPVRDVELESQFSQDFPQEMDQDFDFCPEDFEPLEKGCEDVCNDGKNGKNGKDPCAGKNNKNNNNNKNKNNNNNGCDGNGNGQNKDMQDDCGDSDDGNCPPPSEDDFDECDCPQANPCKIDWKYSVGFQNFFCQYRKKFGGCQKPCKEMLRSAKNHYRDLCPPDKQEYRCGNGGEPDPCRVPPNQ